MYASCLGNQGRENTWLRNIRALPNNSFSPGSEGLITRSLMLGY